MIDEIIDLHDRVVGKMFQMAKHRHEQQFQESGKAINNQLRLYGLIGQALVEAKKTGGDPFAAIESVLSWDAFEASVTQARKLAQPEDFDGSDNWALSIVRQPFRISSVSLSVA